MEKTKENMKKKRNKGFSLVELIVVMAIMGILAVTITPKFMHYVDKSKKAADQEVATAVYTAVKYAMLDENFFDSIKATSDYKKTSGKNVLPVIYKAPTNKSYNFVADRSTWETMDKEIASVLGEFKFKSNSCSSNTELIVTIKSQSEYSVELKFGDGSVPFKMNSKDVVAD